jgi:hypothetical protein
MALSVLNDTRGHGEERIVASLANIVTRMNPGSALANDNRSGVDDLAVENLRAESLGGGIAAVLGRPTGFCL